MVGRILSFDRMKGYGFIRTSNEEDIFLSSYYVTRGTWKRISVGDYVQFVVGRNEFNPKNLVIATDVIVTKKMPRHLPILMPNHEELEVRHIYQFGKQSLAKDGYRELFPNHPARSFTYVFIKTPDRSFLFNKIGSPVVIDGETDVNGYFLYLMDLLVKYDIDRDYESF